ncbi:MAG: family 1 glycosylhydrolase, partial [Candidatus Moraniibacteriota bacterium]
MPNKKLKFPENFLWGVGTSSHQVEGGNENNDWYAWEQKGKTKEFSGIACDSWNRFQEDNALVKSLNCNAYRISLEWSKIEPEENKFSQEAIKHYRDLLVDMKIKGIKRFVTLNHWTVPL